MNATTSSISARIDKKLLKQLEKISKATNRSKSFLVAEALEKYVVDQTWQIEAIKEGIQEADKDNFATDKEIDDFFAKWEIDEG